MKTFFVSILIVAFSSSVFAQSAVLEAADEVGGAEITFENETIDYGKIEKGTDGTRYFSITNAGDEPLTITQCNKSCGCTIPKCPSEPILPGQKADIEVHYDTNRLGQFTKTITVVSNAVNAPSKTVTITGEVFDPNLQKN